MPNYHYQEALKFGRRPMNLASMAERMNRPGKWQIPPVIL
jgi:hypothetical protein